MNKEFLKEEVTPFSEGVSEKITSSQYKYYQELLEKYDQEIFDEHELGLQIKHVNRSYDKNYSKLALKRNKLYDKVGRERRKGIPRTVVEEKFYLGEIAFQLEKTIKDLVITDGRKHANFSLTDLEMRRSGWSLSYEAQDKWTRLKKKIGLDPESVSYLFRSLKQLKAFRVDHAHPENEKQSKSELYKKIDNIKKNPHYKKLKMKKNLDYPKFAKELVNYLCILKKTDFPLEE